MCVCLSVSLDTGARRYDSAVDNSFDKAVLCSHFSDTAPKRHDYLNTQIRTGNSYSFTRHVPESRIQGYRYCSINCIFLKVATSVEHSRYMPQTNPRDALRQAHVFVHKGGRHAVR